MRSKSSALIIILGPLLMIFLIGMAFNNSDQYRVNLGVYSASYSDLSSQMVAGLEEKGFGVTRYNTAEECQESIKQGTQNTCVIFSSDLSVGEDCENEINFTVDYSKVNLVWMVLDAISGEISSTTSTLTTDMTNVLIEKLEKTKKEMAEDSKIILELTSGNKKISENAKASQERLKVMDLSLDMEHFPIDKLDADSMTIEEYLGYLTVHTNTLLSDVRGGVKALEINATKKAPIFEAMDQAESKILAVQTKLDSQTENLTALAKDISLSVKSIKNRMDTAGVSQKDIIENMDEIQSLVDKDLGLILSLKNSFDRIENDILSIRVFDAEDIAMPIQTNIIPITTQTTHLNNLFPSLIVLVIMFISLLLASTLVMMEKRSRAFMRNLLVPTNDFIFILAIFLTSMIVVIFQMFILFLAAQLYFKIDIIGNFGLTFLGLIASSSVFILIGMAIGYFFSREEASTLASISFGSIMLFLSSVIIPIESMPTYIQRFVWFNPFVIAEHLFRMSVLYGSGFMVQSKWFLVLGIYVIVLFVGVYLMQYLIKKVYVTGVSPLVRIMKKK